MARAVNSDQEKPVLGDTCCRLAWATQSVASSNVEKHNEKSTFLVQTAPELAELAELAELGWLSCLSRLSWLS